MRLLLIGLLAAASLMSQPLQRTVLAVYNSAQYGDVRDTRIHRLLEMPLNHLGVVVRYHDVQKGLPPVESLGDVRGIVTWFRGNSMPHPVEFLDWSVRAMESGKRFVVMGDLSVAKDEHGNVTPVEPINRFFAKLGLRVDNWTPVTYKHRVIYQDPVVMDFERPVPAVLPEFDIMKIVDPRMKSHLTVRRMDGDPRTEGTLVVTGPRGGWIELGYTHFFNLSQDKQQWYINPFEFLRLAFDTDELPKPDTTTLDGRRIYYSQIDGDGWRNLTETLQYRRDKISAAEVLLREVILPFPDLPVSVAPIAGDLDQNWFGTRESLTVARKILALPWVEAGSHSYSHPLDWETLYAEPKPGETAPMATVPKMFGQDLWWLDPQQWTAVNRAIERYSHPEAGENKASKSRGHSLLRSYNLYPFDPELEISGSINFLNTLLPEGKRVELMQWSGTTLVPERVLRSAQKARVRNINGGDSRMDREFDSYAWVAPLTRQSGALRQVYSSDANENIYTNSWNERYFGFRLLRETLERTEWPVRLKPIDVYYHMYSGEKQPGVDAIAENLRYARTQEITPIPTSHYAAIVDGFHSLKITSVGRRAWRIENRDGLDTIRFDHAIHDAVDWNNSKGVLGERLHQGSLYVALDPAEQEPVVALTARGSATGRPRLIESRWVISRFEWRGREWSFEARGFGPGDMTWQTMPRAVCGIESAGRETVHAVADDAGQLRFSIPGLAFNPVRTRIECGGGVT